MKNIHENLIMNVVSAYAGTSRTDKKGPTRLTITRLLDIKPLKKIRRLTNEQ